MDIEENKTVDRQEHKTAGRTKNWIKAVAVFYGLSVVASIFLMTRDRAGESSPGKDMEGGLSKVSGLISSKSEGVGWIPIHGAIYESDSARPWEKGAQQWVRKLRSMADKKEIKAIILDINSPGGSVAAVQEIHSEIKRVRAEKKKPVVALFGDVAASGGYYIAAACDSIVAHPGTLTGSIGVIFQAGNVEGLFKKLGIKSEPIKSGRHKDIGSPTRPMTEEEKKILQGIIDDAYSQFLAAVAEGRKIPEEKLRPLADGRIFTGRQAFEAKLVDKLGGSREAADLAGELGGLGKDPKIIRETSSWDQILWALDSGFGGSLPVSMFEGIGRLSHPKLEYMWAY